MVYVIEDPLGGTNVHVTIRAGLDGAWVGAFREGSYVAFPVDPGVHHLCASLQPSGWIHSNAISLRRLTAEAGGVYYFRTRLGVRFTLDLEPVDEDEGQFLVETSAHSTSHPN